MTKSLSREDMAFIYMVLERYKMAEKSSITAYQNDLDRFLKDEDHSYVEELIRISEENIERAADIQALLA